MSAATYFPPPEKLKQSTVKAKCLFSPEPPVRSTFISVPLVKEKHWWKKNVKAALAFPPLHMLLAKLILHSAASIQAASTHPSPLPSSMLAKESRLQRENVINSMERKQGLSIIHVALCCYLWFPSSAHSQWLGWGRPTLCLSILIPSWCDICPLQCCCVHTFARGNHPTQRRLWKAAA